MDKHDEAQLFRSSPINIRVAAALPIYSHDHSVLPQKTLDRNKNFRKLGWESENPGFSCGGPNPYDTVHIEQHNYFNNINFNINNHTKTQFTQSNYSIPVWWMEYLVKTNIMLPLCQSGRRARGLLSFSTAFARIAFFLAALSPREFHRTTEAGSK